MPDPTPAETDIVEPPRFDLDSITRFVNDRGDMDTEDDLKVGLALVGLRDECAWSRKAIAALRADLARVEAERERRFPIQSDRGAAPHPTAIPWTIAELAYSVYTGRFGREQTIDMIASRGGFFATEMNLLLPDWRERCDALSRVTDQLASALADARVLADALKESGFGVRWSTGDRDTKAAINTALARHAKGERIACPRCMPPGDPCCPYCDGTYGVTSIARTAQKGAQ